MTRTIWIGAFCLACIGGMFTIKVMASNPLPTAQRMIVGRATLTLGLVQDNLTNADKLVSYKKRSVDANFVPPTKPPAHVVTATAIANKIPQRLSNPNATRTAVMLPKPRPKIRLAKNDSQDKSAMDTKNCPQPDSLFGVLASVTGSRRCG